MKGIYSNLASPYAKHLRLCKKQLVERNTMENSTPSQDLLDLERMGWKRGTFDTDNIDNGILAKTPVRGLTNGLFGIRYEAEIGFRVTHVNTGWLISRQFFHRLRDAVAFCEAITPLADWRAMTVESGLAAKGDLGPKITAAARKYDYSFVRVQGDEAYIHERKGTAA